jgi:hypothetical protein
MDDLIFVSRFAYHWALQHPIEVAVAIVAFLGVRWLLNRKSAAQREHERIIRGLEEGSRDKYKDPRPLR